VQDGASYGYDEDRRYGSGSLHVLSRPTLRMALRVPDSIDRIIKYGELIVEGNALLVDYSELSDDLAVRAMDYLSGVAYAVDATETEITINVILYMPRGAETIKG
jgi:FtsZ-interacting cell division protein YlmF